MKNFNVTLKATLALLAVAVAAVAVNRWEEKNYNPEEEND